VDKGYYSKLPTDSINNETYNYYYKSDLLGTIVEICATLENTGEKHCIYGANGVGEICGNGIDDDFNGFIDCLDFDSSCICPVAGGYECDNGVCR